MYILLYLLPGVCHPSYKLKSNARQVCGDNWVKNLVVCQTFWIHFVCTIYGDWHYNGIFQEHIWLLHWCGLVLWEGAIHIWTRYESLESFALEWRIRQHTYLSWENRLREFAAFFAINFPVNWFTWCQWKYYQTGLEEWISSLEARV